MTRQASRAIKQPANDMAAFDVSKQSPEDIARLFERWKQQRKRLEPDDPPAKPARSTRFMPVIVRTSAPAEAAPAPVAEPPPSEPDSIHYSAPFADILAPSGEETVAQQVRAFALTPVARPIPRIAARRSKARWILAGAASVLAVAAASAAILWQHSAPQPAAVVAQVAPAAHSGTARPHQAPLPVEVVSTSPEIQTASKLLPLAVQSQQKRGDWQLVLEIALLGPTLAEAESPQTHLAPKLKPKVAAVQTASKPARKPAPTTEPEPDVVTSTNVRPADPRAVSVAVPPAPAPVVSAAPNKRPDEFYERGNDKAVGGGFGANTAASAGKSHSSTGGDPTTGGSGNSGGGSATGGGNTGGSGPGGATGDTGGSTGGGSTGSGSGGSGSGAGGATGGDTGGSTGGGSTGSGSGGSGSGAGGATGGDTGGSTGSGSSGDGTGGSGSGTGGAATGGDTGGSSGSGSGAGGATGGSGSDTGSGSSTGSGGTGGSGTDAGSSGGADVSGGVSVGGGGIGASVGGHVGGVGGRANAGIGN